MFAGDPRWLGLLWRAWPRGYCAAPGVLTFDGSRCVRVEPGPAARAFWVLGDDLYMSHGAIVRAADYSGVDDPSPIAAGSLLPAVDPADPACWAALLADLALTMGIGIADAVGLAFRQEVPLAPRFLLIIDHADGVTEQHRIELPIGWADLILRLDPSRSGAWTELHALALVWACILLRERNLPTGA